MRCRKEAGLIVAVKLCFAMTINRAWGQSLDIVGVDLPLPVFIQALSYVDNLNILLPARL
jgi:hypothetical protein